MQTLLLANRLSLWLAVAVIGLLAAPAANAQLAGPRAIPGDYATVAAAITDLNTQGVGAGGITFNIAAGYAETFTSPTAGAITATGTAANPIVFQKAGAGANPKITAGVGTTTNLDAIISLAGSDYVTLDGLELAENAANTTAPTQMEFGIALFRPTPTDGCQNNTIRNCVVTLNKANTGTFGIYGAATTAALATSVAATSPAGANSGNRINGTTVSNAVSGMYLTANGATTIANYDLNNEIGVTAGNTVTNFGGAATSGWGIGVNMQNGARIANNTVNSAGGAASTSTLRGIYGNTGTSSNIDITNNTVTLAGGATTSSVLGIDNGIGSTAAGNTVNITGNTVTNCTYATATTGTFTGILNSSTPATVNLSNNAVTNNVTAGTGNMALLSSSSATTTVVVNIINNTITGNSKAAATTTASVALFGITLGSATSTVSGNTVTNNSIVTSGTSTSVATLTGINSTAGSTPIENITNNTVTGLSISGTSTATAHVLRGILTSASGASVLTLTQNTVGGLAIASGSGTATGISIPGSAAGAAGSSITRNKIYDLSATGTAGSVSGLVIASSGTLPVANNLIGDLRAPAATSLVAINGISIASAAGVNAYFNTILLNASSTGATFGTSGIYLNSTSTVLDARNNIVVNKSTAAGTGGYTAALRRVSGTAGTAPANLASTTNNNLYFAGPPSATNVIYVEGSATATNAQQTLAAYKVLVANRESSSATEDVPFLSTTGTAATFLHINPAVATQVESGGTPISSVAIDFDGDARNATSPDLGADEGPFTQLDLTGPSITLAPLPNTSSTAARTITVTISDVSGVSTTTAPRLFYRKGTSGAFVSALATSISGTAYAFTFDYAAVGGAGPGDVIQYYVVAQDVPGNVSSNSPGGSFSTDPASKYQYNILNTLSGVYYVGAGTSPDPTRTYTTLTAAAAAYNTSGMAGPVTFLLIDPTYSTAETFPVIFGANLDASATNTFTLKPNTGVTSTITGSNATAIVALNGTDYMTLDGSNGGTISGTDPRPNRAITITNTNASTTSFVVLITVPSTTDNATNNTVRNLNVAGSGPLATQVGIAFLSATGAPAGNNNNVAQNNSVQAAQFGIYSFGVSAAVKNTGTVITQNDLNATGSSALGRVGIIVGFEDGIQITRNAIDGIVFTGVGDVAGISAGLGLAYSSSTFTGSEVTNATISQNNVGVVRQPNTYSAVGIGLAAAASGTSTIANNFVSGVATNATGSDLGAGILVGGGTGSTTRVVFNSVLMTNPTTALTGGNAPGFALAIGGSSPAVEIRNNILVNTQTTGTANSSALGFAYAGTAGSYAGLASSNNDFFVGTASTFAVGQTGSLTNTGVLRATLAALNTETGQDSPATSKNINPLFASASDLHAAAAGLNNAGVPVAGITTDFDGETRNASTPDIGADEFTPAPVDIAASALTSPLAVGCYGATETVAITISNNATAALNFALNPTTVTVTVTRPNSTTQAFTTTLSTGTLATGGTQTVTLPGTLDMSATGTYSFAVATSTPGDGNTANDNLAATRTAIGVATQPQLVTFTGFTGSNLSTVFPGWAEATGTTLPIGTTSAWTSTSFPAGNTTAKINLFSTGKNEWIVSPKFLATTSTVLTFDAGITDFASTSADPAGMAGTDDFVEARISTDCGATFARIPAFAQFNAGNQPSNGSLTNYSISLGTYAGQQIILAFFASEGPVDDTPSYDFHLDNLSVSSPLPIDLAPVALATPAATTSCYSAAETVSITVRNLGTQTLDFAVNPATVTAVVTTPGGPQTLTTTLSAGTLAPSATQIVTLVPTLDMTAIGTYSFAITATVQGDQVTDNDVLPAVTRTAAAPVAGTVTPATATLCVSGTSVLTLTGAANGTIQWQQSADNVTFTDVAGANAATFTTPVLTQTAYFRAQVRCTTTATSNVATITVNNPLVTATNTPLTICTGSTATLTASSSTGASVRFFGAATSGTALATAGSYTTPALTASTTYYAEAFTGSAESVGPTAQSSTGLTPQTAGALYFTTTRALTISAVTVFLNAGQAAGTVTISLRTGSSTSGAVVSSQNLAFAVPAGPAAGVASYVVPLNYSVPAAGQYTLHLSSATQSGLLRDDSGANPAGYPYASPSGALTITGPSIASYYYYFYNWQVSTECASATRTAIQVNVTQPATASFPAATAATCGPSAYQLAGTVTGSATTGTYTSSGSGTFAPNATALNGTYTPSAADVAAGSVTITLTSDVAGACAATTATLALSISPAPVATFSYPAATTYCAGSTSTVTPTLGTGATAGTFSSTTGLTIDPATGIITLSTSTAGTYTVTNSVAASGACAAATATTLVTITPATSAAFSYAGGTFCVSGSNPTATVTGTTGGTFSATAGLTIDATTGTITLSSSTPGTYPVTYRVAGACASSSTQSVTITAAPVATFSYGATPTFCGSGTTTPVPSFGTGASAGTFSSTTGLTIDTTTGAITLASSTPGTYTVTNAIAAGNGCAATTATASVTITAAPVATFSYASPTGCAGNTGAATPTLGTGATAGTFSSTTGLTVNATTGAINLATSTAGTYTVTNTVAAGSGCALATATTTFTVNPRPATPLLTAAYNGTTTTLTSSVTTGNQFFLNGVAITGATGQTYVINGAAAQLGSYTVVVTNANGCASLPSSPLVVTAARNSIAGTSLRVYPNPTPTGEVTLELTGFRLPTQLTVLDALGRVVATELLPATAGTAIHSLNLTGVATGVYLLRLSNTDGTETRRLTRQ